MPDDIEDALDRLYGLPAAQFTAARDALARELRGSGRRAEAGAVRALRRPTAPAAAINQLARQAPDRVQALLAAAHALREVQERLLAGDAGRDELRAATAAERRALGALLAAAANLPEAPSAAALDKVRETLQAAATDDAVREAVARGRLEREAELSGAWGGVALGADTAGPPARSVHASGATDEPPARSAHESAAADAPPTGPTRARGGTAGAAGERRAAKRAADLERARAAAADAQRDLGAAERAAAEARDALRVAAERAEQARAALTDAQTAEAAARESAQRSLRALKRAEAVAAERAERVARLARD